MAPECNNGYQFGHYPLELLFVPRMPAISIRMVGQQPVSLIREPWVSWTQCGGSCEWVGPMLLDMLCQSWRWNYYESVAIHISGWLSAENMTAIAQSIKQHSLGVLSPGHTRCYLGIFNISHEPIALRRLISVVNSISSVQVFQLTHYHGNRESTTDDFLNYASEVTTLEVRLSHLRHFERAYSFVWSSSTEDMMHQWQGILFPDMELTLSISSSEHLDIACDWLRQLMPVAEDGGKQTTCLPILNTIGVRIHFPIVVSGLPFQALVDTMQAVADARQAWGFPVLHAAIRDARRNTNHIIVDALGGDYPYRYLQDTMDSDDRSGHAHIALGSE
jgi:hypothetical protein